jgi:hypothetical protein
MQITSRREHYVALVESMDNLQVVSSRLAHGDAVAPDRITAVTDAWRRQLSRSRILAPGPVQLAIRDYDDVRGAFATAMNAGGGSAAVALVTEMDDTRSAVLLRINDDVNDINSALAPHVLSLRRRLRRSMSAGPSPASAGT